MNVQNKLELSVKHRGIDDELTLTLSRKRDIEIVKEMKLINNIKENKKNVKKNNY